MLAILRYDSRIPSHFTFTGKINQRCGQPGQQQGRRFPSLRFSHPHSIRLFLVSGFLADSIQHIHSLRASGVISSHVSNASESEASAFSRSAGNSCTPPPEIRGFIFIFLHTPLKAFTVMITFSSYAALSFSISSFFICNMACVTRSAFSLSGLFISSPITEGIICHDRPYLSLSQPHCSASGTDESFSQ